MNAEEIVGLPRLRGFWIKNRMWTRRIQSGTKQYPTRADTLRHLILELTNKGIAGSWVHVELISESGWFDNLWSGRQPWIEIGFVAKNCLEIAPGFPKSVQKCFPEKWRNVSNKQCVVPITDLEELLAWIDSRFAESAVRPEYRICGWIEGL